MQLTIVKEDNLVIVGGKEQTFDFSSYSLPENFWALQWKDDVGEIEYNNKENKKIDAVPVWVNPIIEEHKRLTEEQKLQQKKENQQNFFLQNGQVRINRIQRKIKAKQDKELNQIKDLVRGII